MLFITKAVSKIIVPLLLLLLLVAAAGAEKTAAPAREGEVTAGVLNVRSGPGKTYRIIGKLLKGARVEVLSIEPNWLKISRGELEGYVWRQHVRLLPAPAPEKETASRETGTGPAAESGSLDPETASIESRSTESEEEFAPPPFDASIPPEDLQRLEQEAGRIENQIAQHEAQVSAYSDKEAQLIEELDQLGRQLNRTKLQVKSTREEVDRVEASLKETELEIGGLKKEIAILDVYAAKRLVSLYKLHQLGKMPVLASADSIFDLLNRKNALERILAADKTVWDDLTQKKGRFENLQDTLAQQKRLHSEKLEQLGGQLASMNRQNTERSNLLDEVRGKKSLMLAAIDSLKQAAFALDKELEGNNWEIHPAGGFTDVENKKPFQTLKGLLQTPVPGKITAFYGLAKNGALNSVNFRNGIEIEAEPGEPIRAVHGGSVLYADWFRGYGNLIILDHGNGFCTVYAHAEELFKKKGDPVDSNEVIGTVGDTGSLAGTKLYFEIRHEGKPIDPLAWLNRD